MWTKGSACPSSQAGGSSSRCPRLPQPAHALALPREPRPSLVHPSLHWGTAGWLWEVPVLLGVSLQAGPMVLTWGGFAALPSQVQRRFPRALKFFHVPPELGMGMGMGMGRTKGPIPSTLQQGGPADMPGGTAWQPPAASYLQPDMLPCSRRAAASGVPCGTWGSPHQPCGAGLGDTQGPFCPMGCRATGQGCPQVLWVLSRQWGWHWDNPMGFTWD